MGNLIVGANNTITVSNSTDNNNFGIIIGDADVDDDYNDLPLLIEADSMFFQVDDTADYRTQNFLPEFPADESKDDDWKKRNDLRYIVQDGFGVRPSAIPRLTTRVPPGHTQGANDRIFTFYDANK